MITQDPVADYQSERTDLSCDLLVAGSGAAGLATAIVAAHHGLRVLLVEKAPTIGGTTAWSGGWMWIPMSPPAIRSGIDDSLAKAQLYLHNLGLTSDDRRLDAYLVNGPAMIDFFEKYSAVEFISGIRTPDFYESPGAVGGGRSTGVQPYDGRRLGSYLRYLRPPLSTLTIARMGIASGSDSMHFTRTSRSLRSFAHVAALLGRHGWDLIRFRRSVHLVNGNALIARLLETAIDLGVDIWLQTELRSLSMAASGVTGAIVRSQRGDMEVRAKRGVVLATGGYPHDDGRLGKTFDHVKSGRAHYSIAPRSNTGDGLNAVEAIGGAVSDASEDPAGWVPVSLVPNMNGECDVFPHLLDRSRPGSIAVLGDGKRFVNEAVSYHDFVRSMLSATSMSNEAAVWLICDSLSLKRYGLGWARPFPFRSGRYVRLRYLHCGDTLDALARSCGIDGTNLLATVAAFNAGADQGIDSLFGRGTSAFDRHQGDEENRPNPSLRALRHGPFFAVQLHVGSIATFSGIATDCFGRVLNSSGAVVNGLYAVGNDMASVFGGRYPSGGITLGPAMTFGFIVGRHAAGINARDGGAASVLRRGGHDRE